VERGTGRAEEGFLRESGAAVRTYALAIARQQNTHRAMISTKAELGLEFYVRVKILKHLTVLYR
jgi:hypothetical protein